MWAVPTPSRTTNMDPIQTYLIKTPQVYHTDLGLKDEFLIHLVFASLPKEYETFVDNYNMQPDKWDIEKLIAMC